MAGKAVPGLPPTRNLPDCPRCGEPLTTGMVMIGKYKRWWFYCVWCNKTFRPVRKSKHAR